jgi:UDP-glucose 4-epimerase
MNVLVTGGAGYIGSVITEELLGMGHSVTVLDNLVKGHKGAVDSRAFLVEGGIQDEHLVKKILQNRDVEAVIHMAASSLVGESVQQPKNYYNNNIINSLSLLNSMIECNVRKIVFSSTAAVYGEPVKQPIEESDPTAPTNTYGETKLSFEKALAWYSKAYGIQYTSLRYFNAAGASEKFGEHHNPETHLIPAILRVAAGKGERVELYGDDYPTRDGTCLRDYIHVIDLARAHILALENQGNSIFNLGCGGEGYTVREVLNVAKEVTNRDIPSRISARRPGDPAALIASSVRIRQELGWKPEFQDLRAIISSAWKWMQSHPNGYES